MSEQSEIRVIIFGHSFIHRLLKFLVVQYGREFVHNVCFSDDLQLKMAVQYGHDFSIFVSVMTFY